MREALLGAGVPVADDAPRDSGAKHPAWLVPRQVGVNAHAVERYRERVAPALDFQRAKVALYKRFEIATFSREPPRWLVNVSTAAEPPETLGYVLIEDDLALPLRETRGRPTKEGHLPNQPFYVVTCLVRLGFDGEWRNTRVSPTSDLPTEFESTGT